MIDEVTFLHADKHHSFLQVKFFEGFGQVCPNYTDKFELSLQYLKKDVRNEVHFLHVSKHQGFQ